MIGDGRNPVVFPPATVFYQSASVFTAQQAAQFIATNYDNRYVLTSSFDPTGYFSISSSVTSLSTSYYAFSGTLQGLSASYVGTSASFVVLSGTFASFSSAYTGFSSSISNVSSAFSSVSSSYQSLSGGYVSVSASYANLSGAFTGVSASYVNLSSAFTTISASYTRISSSYNLLSASYTSLSGGYTAVSSSFSSVSQSYTQISSSYVSLSGGYAGVSSSYTSLSGGYTTVSASFSSVSQSYTQVSASYTSVSQSYSQVSASYNVLSRSYNAFSASTGVVLQYLTYDGTYVAATKPFSASLIGSSYFRTKVIDGYISGTTLNVAGTGKGVSTNNYGSPPVQVVFQSFGVGYLSHLTARAYNSLASAGALTCSIVKNSVLFSTTMMTYQAVGSGFFQTYIPGSSAFAAGDNIVINVEANGWSQPASNAIGVNFVLWAYT